MDRTTEGSNAVYDMTVAQVQALDAAHDFVPGVGTASGRPEADYAPRGVRTGGRRPPAGHEPDDFRILTLEEVLAAYPDVPINIEIKGRSDLDQGSFMTNAERLAALLNRLGRKDGVIVASFSDLALVRFRALALDVGLAPGVAGVAASKLGVTPMPGTVAYQMPITFEGLQVTDGPTVERLHAQGYAVHVWLSNDTEDRATYELLLGWGVDGIMAAQPAALEALLCERGTPRPAFAFAHHCAAQAAPAACASAPATRVSLRGRRRVLVRIVREGDTSAACPGRVSVRAGGDRVAGGRFEIAAWRRAAIVRLPIRRRPARHVVVRVQPDGGAAARARLRLR